MLERGSADEFAQELRRMRKAHGMTQRALARAMAYDQSRISQVESGRSPASEEFARQADFVLAGAGKLVGLFRSTAVTSTPAPERDLTLTDFVAWLADHSPLDFSDAYAAVSTEAAALEREPASVRHARAHARGRIGRADVASTLADWYGPEGLYRAEVAGEPVHLGVFTRPEWLTPVALPGDEHVTFTPGADDGQKLDETAARAAVRRLASAEVSGTVMVNNPLYRLLSVDFTAGVAAQFSTVPFAAFALGTDMLEAEAVAGAAGGDMPLRRELLPDTASVFDLSSRPCVGGLAATVAVARQDDYVIFVQERSGTVVNGAGRLATIPQAFHQPTSEAAREVLLSTTLTRELEEEMLGREDLEQPGRQGDVLHEQATSEPMAWLRARPGSFRTEVTGLCLNAAAGNYVFSCLAVIEDPSWWEKFGHLVEANWEAQRIHRYSTRDAPGLQALIADPRWADIGLFTLLQGLHRLADTGAGARLRLPAIGISTG